MFYKRVKSMLTSSPLIEIMSPVGSYEALMAAIHAGAGSVYFGVGEMNMRARSSANFTLEDLEKIAQICKENNVLSYLTVNTVIYNHEIEAMHILLNAAKKSGISAIIASDMAVMNYCKQIGLEIHISTQCNITNFESVKYYAQFADVIVLARETELKDVKQIVKRIEEEKICGPKGELVKIEMFIHGALCMAVSGKCYISLDNFNYSANRGACLQPCRRGYHVKDVDSEIELAIENQYIMSPKDLCTIGFLDKILDAGVTVLKIEGRGRSPEYVKMVTQCYHEAIKAIQNQTYNKEKIEEWTTKLRSVYNRDFWDGYYLGQKVGEWTQNYGSQATRTKQYVGKITNYFSKLQVAEILIETNEISVGDEIMIFGSTTGVIDVKVNEIRVDLEPVNQTVKGEYCSIFIPELVRRNDKVYRWVETEI
ncbi:MAG: U32 family peptidase [Bacteroidetes bacterium]|nr:U32 family peptidase [Bacteroidota bacterium]MCL1968936.1 U32 family peptidase [Bacteroidota bacterium]